MTRNWRTFGAAFKVKVPLTEAKGDRTTSPIWRACRPGDGVEEAADGAGDGPLYRWPKTPV